MSAALPLPGHGHQNPIHESPVDVIDGLVSSGEDEFTDMGIPLGAAGPGNALLDGGAAAGVAASLAVPPVVAGSPPPVLSSGSDSERSGQAVSESRGFKRSHAAASASFDDGSAEPSSVKRRSDYIAGAAGGFWGELPRQTLPRPNLPADATLSSRLPSGGKGWDEKSLQSSGAESDASSELGGQFSDLESVIERLSSSASDDSSQFSGLPFDSSSDDIGSEANADGGEYEESVAADTDGSENLGGVSQADDENVSDSEEAGTSSESDAEFPSSSCGH